ncbi:MAG TPA: MFS transporter [Blastocatellia bacterium]|nr:MFS transporter [Blastocatellia bacterium]
MKATAWMREISTDQRRALVAAALGWMLDSMDVMLYAMVLAHLMRDLKMSTATAGLLGSLTLLASAVGGVLFGILADRVGRTRALMASILVYSIFTAACGVAQTIGQLALFRVLLGLGMGGEWATGAALVAETWPPEHRGKALGLMQSSWAIGYALAAGITALVLPRFGWRAVFFVGIAPALVTVWIRHSLREPDIWQRSRHTRTSSRPSLMEIFRYPLRRHTLTTTLMNASSMFAWWGLFTWIPPFLALPPEKGGAGLSIVQTSTWVILMQAGMWVGYVTFGFISDSIGRKPTYIAYLLAAALLVPLYGMTRHPTVLLLLGPLVAFFGTGYFSGFGAITAELFPTSIRATAQGFTYNIGRGASALAPFTIGSYAETHGLGLAFMITAAAYLLAALIAFALPETKGKALD